MRMPMQFAAQFCLLFFLATGANRVAAETVPGVVIHHQPAAAQIYLGSPSLAVLANGRYVASHDFFGPGSNNDRTAVYDSADRGATWRRLTEIQGQWWSTLFTHRGALYLIGTSRQDGYCVIRRSTDGGQNWTEPADAKHGLLLGDAKYHCAPVPVVEHNGRLWRAMEDVMGPGGWGSNFRSFMMSVPVEADLLDAGQWTFSNRLGRDPQWLDGKFGGWLEGNAVITPEGRVVNILRADYRAGNEKAAMIQISEDGRVASFDPVTGFIDFPGGCKKFTIRRDPKGAYWSLANFVPEGERRGNPERTRNTLALIRSTDLKKWEVRAILLHHGDPARFGFQYVDWQFEGNDIIAVVRTAFDDDTGGAHNQHDANFITFQRFQNFRSLQTAGVR
ncbi:MAG TPA: sialidase family protein [Verrucomicrobiae bacterium]|nr:sialidase family protein [Verrucomicrobiae bacterium]